MEYVDIYCSKLLTKKEKWVALPKDLLIAICKSDTLNVKEGELFEGVIAWGKAALSKEKQDDSVDNLKKVLADVMPHIRFPTMQMQDIAVKVTASGLLEQDQILELFTYLGMKNNDKKAALGKSIKVYSAKDRKGRRPPSWFKWDTTKKHASIMVSEDGMTLTSTNQSYYQPVFGDKEMSEGIWEYEVKLTQYYTGSYSVCVGCVPATFTNYTVGHMIGYPGHITGWSFACANAQSFHNTQTAYGRACAQNDVVRVKIDLDKRNMEFFINGQSQGVAFTDVTGPVRPAISLYGMNTCTLQFPQ
jgi:hypothetical protein